MADLSQELTDKLQITANKEGALLMSFIAPESIVRVSPASVDYARIRVQDLYNIEKKVEEIKKTLGKLPEKLHLVIHSPGGDLYASTKIAYYLQKVFGTTIQAFVPYEAASGGTLLCLSAKSIVMDEASNLTPIDPQTVYKGKSVSVTSYEQALKDFKKDYGNLKPEDLPNPYAQLANHFEPIIAKEMDRRAWDMLNVAYKLLLFSQEAKTQDERNKCLRSVFKLGNSDSPHTHVISADEAKKFGLNIDESTQSHTLLMLYKEWVSVKLNERTVSHIIDAFYPEKKKKEVKNEQKKDRKKS